MRALLKETDLLLTKLTANNDFAFKLMTAAQASDRKEVEKLIKSAGVMTKSKISFNPDSIRMELGPDIESSDCCKLAISLRWN
ncbi:hypothetical protein F9802_03740 [Bacillus aerolatus]|uniref:Uncharacterized protein n=1 Tax=Bacillus aerolatus TaxID=2653354 RepID=A0A6I1FLH3_9BACI|nr:hypothetical protein [Bacillus aerolatus]KAB7707833.1 hypothetical protein F9802_03740 [Bacillus aerolatus]